MRSNYIRLYQDMPELFRYLDMDRNNDENIDVLNFTYGVSKDVWWKTPNDISFKRCFSTVVRQYKKNKKLPFDTTNVCIAGYNDILTTEKYIKEIWDFEKNNKLGLDPSRLTNKSGKKAYFKCFNCGKTTDKPFSIFHICRQKHAFCDRCSRNFHTSIQEQIVYFYVRGICKSAINGYKGLFKNKTYELDIYIPEYKLGIEYDGCNWHINKEKRDDFKYSVCHENDIKLLRICDNAVSKTKCDDRVVTNSILSNEDMRNVMTKISEITGNNLFKEQKIDIDNDIYDILKSFRSVIVSKSFAFKNPDIVERWDYELNHGVSPWCVFANTKQKFWFKSKYGPFQKSLNKLTSGRQCLHPREAKENCFEKKKRIYYLYDTKTGEDVKTDIHYLHERFGNFGNVSVISRGSNNFFIGNTQFMLFAEKYHTIKNIRKYSKLGPRKSKKYTLEEIINKSKEYKTFKDFRLENRWMYRQILRNNWFKYIELYQTAEVPYENRNAFCCFNEGYRIPNTNFTVIKEVEPGKDGKRRLLCRCDCGNEYIVYLQSVITINGRYPRTKMCMECSIKNRTAKIKDAWKRKMDSKNSTDI